MTKPLPASVDETLDLLAHGDYVAERSLATALFLSLKLNRPLFLEGEAGVGKTEIAKVLSATLGRRLVRLQCYEGLDVSSAVYEWNYARQMIEIRLAEATGDRSRESLGGDIFSPEFLIKRPLLQALESSIEGPPVLLIDELDRTDEPFEAYLLEVLSDFQITIPELGTIKAEQPPMVIITSNRTREIHDALKRRCFYHWVDYPERRARAGNPAGEGPRRAGAAVAAGRRIRPEAAEHGPVQAAGSSGDAGLGTGADPARPAGTGPRDDQRHARHPAEVPGRHRPNPGQRGEPHPDPGQGRTVRSPARSEAGMVQDTRDIQIDGGRLSANIMHFARCLRVAGMPIGPGKVLQALEAVEAVGIGNRRDFYWTLHAVFVNRRDQRELFDQAFHVFWRNPDILKRMMALLLPSLKRRSEAGRAGAVAPAGRSAPAQQAEAGRG